MKPTHFRKSDPKVCQTCEYIYLSYHHCNACSDSDEYSCMKHDFIIGSIVDIEVHICDDYLESD